MKRFLVPLILSLAALAAGLIPTASALAAPANDNLASAQVVGPALPIAEAGTTVGATVEAGELHPGDGHSVWFSWTAPTAGPVRVDVCDYEVANGPGNFGLWVYTGQHDRDPGRSREPMDAAPGQRAQDQDDDRPEPHERRAVRMPQATGDRGGPAVDAERDRPPAGVAGFRCESHAGQRVQPSVVPAQRVAAAHLRPLGRRTRSKTVRRHLGRTLVQVVHGRVLIHRDAGGREAQVRRPAVVEHDDGLGRRGVQPHPLVAVDHLGAESGGQAGHPGEVAGRDRGDRPMRVRGPGAAGQTGRDAHDRDRHTRSEPAVHRLRNTIGRLYAHHS